MVKAVCSQPESSLFSRPRTSWALLHRQLNGYGAQMYGSLECCSRKMGWKGDHSVLYMQVAAAGISL
jgi:hypothetical protein